MIFYIQIDFLINLENQLDKKNTLRFRPRKQGIFTHNARGVDKSIIGYSTGFINPLCNVFCQVFDYYRRRFFFLGKHPEYTNWSLV
jgi:hypothetical protein